MWTKRQLIEEAFGELALAGYVFDLTPEEMQTALRRMDTMLATWDGKGIRLGYALTAGPDTSDLDQPSGLPDAANEAVYLNLAIRLAAGFGKPLQASTLAAAKQAYDALITAAAMPTQQQLRDTLPRGAGNKPWRTAGNPFISPPDLEPLRVGEGGDLDFLGD